MPPSDDTIRKIAEAFRRHVDAATLEKIINELLDVPGNKSFRDAIETLARELMQRSDCRGRSTNDRSRRVSGSPSVESRAFR